MTVRLHANARTPRVGCSLGRSELAARAPVDFAWVHTELRRPRVMNAKIDVRATATPAEVLYFELFRDARHPI